MLGGGAPLKVLLASACFGLGAVLAKLLSDVWSPLQLAALSIVAGWVLLTVHLLVVAGTLPGRVSWRRDGIPILFMSCLGTAAALWLVLIGIQRTSASLAGLLLQMDMVGCIVLSLLVLKERIALRQWVGIISSTAGALVLTIGSAPEGKLLSAGAVCVLLGGLLFGGGIVASRLLVTSFSALELSWWRLSGAAPLLLLLWSVTPQEGIPPLPRASLLWAWGLYSVTNFYLAYVLLSIAIRRMEAWRVSSILRTIPFFTLVFAILLLDERLTRIMILGGALLLFGQLLAERSPAPPLEG